MTKYLLVVVLCLGWTSAWAAEFAPPFCEFKVNFPVPGKPIVMDLDFGRSDVERAQSAEVSADTYFFRAQCVRFRECFLNRFNDELRIADLQYVADGFGGLINRVLSLVDSRWGRAGRVDGNMSMSGHDLLVRAMTYYGNCTRLLLTFATESTRSAGFTEWGQFINSIQMKP